jgi:hypothetical protein
LEHPTNLQAKVYAWSRVDYEHSDANKLFDKASSICVQFSKDANACWQAAFGKIIACHKRQL